MTSPSPRDLIGYGPNPPNPDWPGGARLAVQFVLNYEEGGESCILYGDPASEAFLSEVASAHPLPGQRHLSVESCYEYGSRAGVWRLFRLFQDKGVPLTLFAVAMALARNPAIAKAAVSAGYDICAHGHRWLDYQNIPEEIERTHLREAVATITRLTGTPPLGWYTGRNSPNTRRLVVEHGGFLYDSDDYSDDLPFWTKVDSTPHLVIPYTLDANDMRFATPQGFNSGEQFFHYLKDTFDTLYEEGRHAPKMMSIGLHCRLAGRPGRSRALARFLDYLLGHRNVWCCRRIDIARHWQSRHPAPCPAASPLL